MLKKTKYEQICPMTYNIGIFDQGSVKTKTQHLLNGLSRNWLMAELQKRQISQVNRVSFASINSNHELHISLKTEQQQMLPIYH